MAEERFPVEAGHIMLFARAVGETNPIYFDADAAARTEPGGIIAPPTFVQASAQFDPDYGLRPKPGQWWFGSGKAPSGSNIPDAGSQRPPSSGGGTGLHAEQHYEYHRHLRPGDVLRAVTKPGREWEAEGRRAGKLQFSETITEYYDQHDELVITARSVGVRTERPVQQG